MADAPKVTLPGIPDDDNALLNALLKQLSDREARNYLRASYYDGRRAISQVGSVIPPQYHRLGIVLGWTSKAVDVLARRCNLDGFVWADGDLDSLGARDLFEANHLRAETNSAVVASLIHGPSFLVNTVGDGASEPSSLIHVRDARSATGTWNARARRLDNLLSVTSRDDKGRPTSLALYLDGRTVVAEKDGRRWQVDVQEHPWGVPAELVAYKPRVGRPFGSSRISRPVMALQDRAVAELIRTEGHMDVYSYPEMWMLGADKTAFLNDDGTQQADWQVMLGRVKAIPDDDEAEGALARVDVKQFPASSPEPHLAWLNALAKLFARETSLPDSALAVTDFANPTSAESYDASQYELIAEAEGATDDWSPAFRRAFARGLAIQNGLDEVPDEWRTIDAKWRDPRYQSRAAMADAGAKQIATVPWLAESEVGLELLGLDEQQIQRAMSDRRRASAPALLESIRAAASAAAPEPEAS